MATKNVKIATILIDIKSSYYDSVCQVIQEKNMKLDETGKKELIKWLSVL